MWQANFVKTHRCLFSIYNDDDFHGLLNTAYSSVRQQINAHIYIQTKTKNDREIQLAILGQ